MRWLGLLAASLLLVGACSSSNMPNTSNTSNTANLASTSGTDSAPISADTAPSTFTLSSPVMDEGGVMPAEFTCDGSSSTPPLGWSGAPAGTIGYALIMHHVPGPGDTHWYWVLWDLPAELISLDVNATVAGSIGTNSVNSRNEYAPPCSKGPGTKTYTFTVYALDAQPDLPDPTTVTRQVLLDAILGHVLASAELNVTYTRSGTTGSQP